MKSRPFKKGIIVPGAMLLVMMLCFANRVNAQEEQADSISIELDTLTRLSTYPVPKKAVLWSIVPGGGQIYNKSWIKVPFAYAGFVGVGYAINFNQTQYRRLRDALNLKRAGEPHEFSGTRLDDEQSLKSLRNQYDKYTQLSYIGVVIWWVVTTADAFVEAHLTNFDIDEDLGHRIKPIMEQLPGGEPILGIGISIPLNKNKPAATPRQLLSLE